jgi:hypothetical protein
MVRDAAVERSAGLGRVWDVKRQAQEAAAAAVPSARASVTPPPGQIQTQVQENVGTELPPVVDDVSSTLTDLQQAGPPAITQTTTIN